MSAFIPDTSVSMAWCFEDETNPYSEELLARLEAHEEALVPCLWPLEVANALVKAKLRGRVTETQVAGFLEDLPPVCHPHRYARHRSSTYRSPIPSRPVPAHFLRCSVLGAGDENGRPLSDLGRPFTAGCAAGRTFTGTAAVSKILVITTRHAGPCSR